MKTRRIVMLLLVLASAFGAYVVGGEFVRADYYKYYWLVLAGTLIISWAWFWYRETRLNPRTSWLVGLIVGSVISLATMFTVRVVDEAEFLTVLSRTASQLGMFELLYFLVVGSFLHFGWLPFLVLFGSLSLSNTE